MGAAVPADFTHIRICRSRYAGAALALEAGAPAGRWVLPAGVMRVNDPLSVREAVRGGIGAGLLPERYCASVLAEGALCEVWQGLRIAREVARLALVFPRSRLLSPRFRGVIGFLEEICRGKG